MAFHIGQNVTYIGGHMVTMLRTDGKDGGNPTVTGSSKLARR